MTKFSRKIDHWFAHSDDSLDLHDRLPSGNYTIKFNPSLGFFLEKIESFKPLQKIYGNLPDRSKRILQTYFDRPYQTGVLLSGEKGSGKTLLARQISISAYERDIPTIIINESFTGEAFMEFLTSINQPTIILFDEFEKVYSERNAQQSILTLLDGVFPSKKLFIMTVNESHRLDTNMINRPGRIFYSIKYDGLDEAFIIEYVNDILVNKNNASGIFKIISLFRSFNFDMLKALVEEMNRYDETAAQALQLLNISPEYDSTVYSVSVATPDGLVIDGQDRLAHMSPNEWSNPLATEEIGVQFVHPLLKDNDGDSEWISTIFTLNDIVETNSRGIVYKNPENYTMTLTKQKPRSYDWRSL